jgi:copper chaperone CopZ
MEKTNWKVEGMTCSNCSLTVSKYLEKQGKKNVKVSLLSGEVNFDNDQDDAGKLIKGIEDLGYTVKTDIGKKRIKIRKGCSVAICSGFFFVRFLHCH